MVVSKSPKATLSVHRSESNVVTLRVTFSKPTGVYWSDLFNLLPYTLAIVCGFAGNWIWQVDRNFDGGVPWLCIAFSSWLFAESYENRQEIVSWGRRQDRLGRARWLVRSIPIYVGATGISFLVQSMSADGDTVMGLIGETFGRLVFAGLLWLAIDVATWLLRNRIDLQEWISKRNTRQDVTQQKIIEPSPKRRSFRIHVNEASLAIVVAASISSFMVWTNTSNNRIEPPIILLWLGSALLWSIAFRTPLDSPAKWLSERKVAFRSVRWRAHSWFVLAFVVIMILGLHFRFAHLNELPREMYPDHADAIYDAYRISEGNYEIMFSPREDGREPLHYYLFALFAKLPGLGFNHFSLKMLAALESLMTLPLLVWLGVELMSEKRRKFGLVVGLIMAGLVAVSYWHVVISRYALRTHLTTPFAAMVIIYLVRAIRHNRRSDFVSCGLVLGFSFYAYTASRFLPLAVFAAVAISIVICRHSWRERLKYAIHLAVLFFVSAMVLLPMLHYMLDQPQTYWQQVSMHLSGHDTVGEHSLEIFNHDNVAVFLNNVKTVFLSFNWSGDGDWIHAVNRQPATDLYTGTFLVLGLAALVFRMVASGDMALRIIPLILFFTLLPGMLSLHIAWALPDNTRMSGAIPVIYFVAALPIAHIAFRFLKYFPGRFGRIAAAIFCGVVLSLAAARNRDVYFEDFAHGYVDFSQPYSELGAVIKGFADSDGVYANAFVIERHWNYHRAIALETGADPRIAHRTIREGEIPSYIRAAKDKDGPYQLKADHDLLFIYKADNETLSAQLATWFPTGRELLRQAYDGKSYALFRVPALGEAGIDEFLRNHA